MKLKLKKSYLLGIAGLFVIVFGLSAGVFLVQKFALKTPKAVTDVTVSFNPATANLPPNSTLSVSIDAGTKSVAFAQIGFTFDKTKVRLSGEIQPITTKLQTEIQRTTQVDANNTGSAHLVLALAPGNTAPTGTFEFARIPITAFTTTANQVALVSLNLTDIQIVDTAGNQLTVSGNSATLNLNTTRTASPSPSPSHSPTASPTLRPTASPTASPTSSPFVPEEQDPRGGSTTIVETTLSLSAPSASPTSGQEFNLAVNINTGNNIVVAAELYLTFDPAKLEAVNITPGTFLTNATNPKKQIDNVNGALAYALLLPTSQTAKQGIGTLANITFKAKVPGEAAISWSQNTLIGATSTNGLNALLKSTGLSLNIQGRLGDINRDGNIDILDYTILFENFGLSNPTNQNADINGDGEVNILDYVIFYENFDR